MDIKVGDQFRGKQWGVVYRVDSAVDVYGLAQFTVMDAGRQTILVVGEQRRYMAKYFLDDEEFERINADIPEPAPAKATVKGKRMPRVDWQVGAYYMEANGTISVAEQLLSNEIQMRVVAKGHGSSAIWDVGHEFREKVACWAYDRLDVPEGYKPCPEDCGRFKHPDTHTCWVCYGKNVHGPFAREKQTPDWVPPGFTEKQIVVAKPVPAPAGRQHDYQVFMRAKAGGPVLPHCLACGEAWHVMAQGCPGPTDWREKHERGVRLGMLRLNDEARLAAMVAAAQDRRTRYWPGAGQAARMDGLVAHTPRGRR